MTENKYRAKHISRLMLKKANGYSCGAGAVYEMFEKEQLLQ